MVIDPVLIFAAILLWLITGVAILIYLCAQARKIRLYTKFVAKQLQAGINFNFPQINLQDYAKNNEINKTTPVE
jgi:hypothetical protein